MNGQQMIHRVRPPAARARGLSLVEVLASLALVAIVMPVAMHCVSLATSASSLAKQRMIATTLAQARMDEIIATHDYATPQQQGDFGENYPGFQWIATAVDFDTSVKEVQVTVTWESWSGQQNVTLTTLIFTDV